MIKLTAKEELKLRNYLEKCNSEEINNDLKMHDKITDILTFNKLIPNDYFKEIVPMDGFDFDKKVYTKEFYQKWFENKDKPRKYTIGGLIKLIKN